jgi:3-phosphoglycerate kinase/myo-inositol catabolism protein IolC
MSKLTCLARLCDRSGQITIAALDHRGSLAAALHPEHPESTTDAEILAWKKRLVNLYKNTVSGILIDPIYGPQVMDTTASCGWMFSMEKTGYRGGKEARVTELLPDWSVAAAKAHGASGVKLLLYYDPSNRELAIAQYEVARQVALECEREELVFLLEPLSYRNEADKVETVLQTARDLADLPVDIYKFEYPGSREACAQLTEIVRRPWVLLSAGMEYQHYRHALADALAGGARGFAVGRAVWQEFSDYEGAERERYFDDVAAVRMHELVELTNAERDSLPRLELAAVTGKRVLVRVDWNVTLGKALEIVDDTRIVRTLPTIRWLLDHDARQIVLLSHLGKAADRQSLESVARYAQNLLGRDIEFVSTIARLHDCTNRIVMLENVRFFPGEEANDPSFAKELASLGDVYVNEAFGESHRDVASITGIPRFLPSYAGKWLMEEVRAILFVRDTPTHPFVVVMGGAKIEDKLPLLVALSQRADTILVGGKLANELQANGRWSMADGQHRRANLIVPVEPSYAKASAGEGEYLDIGEETRKIFAEEIAKAKTIVWNGPMGKIEEPAYRAGTQAVYEAMVMNEAAYTLVGGGDTLAAVGREEQIARIDHVSTGGGAMLKLLECGDLVGLEALRRSVGAGNEP